MGHLQKRKGQQRTAVQRREELFGSAENIGVTGKDIPFGKQFPTDGGKITVVGCHGLPNAGGLLDDDHAVCGQVILKIGFFVEIGQKLFRHIGKSPFVQIIEQSFRPIETAFFLFALEL